MPMIAPSSPAYRSQPSEMPDSTVTRFFTDGGRTQSRYAWSCASKRSQQGRLTTRVGTPSASRSSAASKHSCSSDPVPIRISSGVRPPSASRRTYPPRRTPSRASSVVPVRVGSFWRVSARATGPLVAPAIDGRSTASAQAAAASFASPGRTNHRFGIARRAA